MQRECQKHCLALQGTALRGVQEMLQGKPGQVQSAGQAQAVPLELARQPWMDLPDWQHTPQQRAALKEHDQKLQVSFYCKCKAWSSAARAGHIRLWCSYLICVAA